MKPNHPLFMKSPWHSILVAAFFQTQFVAFAQPARTIVGLAALTALGLLFVSECCAQLPTPYVPPPDSVEIVPQTTGGIVSVLVSVELPSTCEYVSSWDQLQYRSALTTNQWTPLTPWVPGNGSRLCTNDAVFSGSAQRFYRVARTNAPPTL